MLFSSMIFLWLFLPVVFCLYYLVKKEYRNVLLLASSIIFYAWGGVSYTLIMFSSIIINYVFALLIDKAIEDNNKIKKKIYLIFCIVLNLLILGYFKYTDFAISIINSISGKEVISLKNIVLPIGISFYTFQALSYVIDVYREQNLYLYIYYCLTINQIIEVSFDSFDYKYITDRNPDIIIFEIIENNLKNTLLNVIPEFEIEKINTLEN